LIREEAVREAAGGSRGGSGMLDVVIAVYLWFHAVSHMCRSFFRKTLAKKGKGNVKERGEW